MAGRTLLAPGVPRGGGWWRRGALVTLALRVEELEVGQVADNAPRVKGTPGIVEDGEVGHAGEVTHAGIDQTIIGRIIVLGGSGCRAGHGKASVVVVYLALSQFDGVPWGIWVFEELVYGEGNTAGTLRVLEHHGLAQATKGAVVAHGETCKGVHVYRPCKFLGAERIRRRPRGETARGRVVRQAEGLAQCQMSGLGGDDEQENTYRALLILAELKRLLIHGAGEGKLAGRSRAGLAF